VSRPGGPLRGSRPLKASAPVGRGLPPSGDSWTDSERRACSLRPAGVGDGDRQASRARRSGSGGARAGVSGPRCLASDAAERRARAVSAGCLSWTGAARREGERSRAGPARRCRGVIESRRSARGDRRDEWRRLRAGWRGASWPAGRVAPRRRRARDVGAGCRWTAWDPAPAWPVGRGAGRRRRRGGWARTPRGAKIVRDEHETRRPAGRVNRTACVTGRVARHGEHGSRPAPSSVGSPPSRRPKDLCALRPRRRAAIPALVPRGSEERRAVDQRRRRRPGPRPRRAS